MMRVRIFVAGLGRVLVLGGGLLWLAPQLAYPHEEDGSDTGAHDVIAPDHEVRSASERNALTKNMRYSGIDADEGAAAWAVAQQDIEAYAARAEVVVVGTVRSVKNEEGRLGEVELVLLEVEEVLRGRRLGEIVEFRQPHRIIQKGGQVFQAGAVQGYKLLVFLDEAGWVVDGMALYYVEGGHAFRARRPSVFLKPSADRDWIEQIDPTEDYVVVDMSRVREAVEPELKKRIGRSRRVRRKR